MKPSKKKRKSRASRPVDRDAGGDEENEDNGVLKCLIEAFSSASIDEVASAYREANGDANKAAEILSGFFEKVDDPPGSSSSLERSFEANVFHKTIRFQGFRGNKQKKVVASAGTVSSVLGKDYVMSSPRKDSQKSKGLSKERLSNEEAEQFLCSMLGDGCDLSMAVVRDVLSQCGYDVEKALDALLDLSASSCDQFQNDSFAIYCENDKEDRGILIECSDSLDDTVGKCKLTDMASDSTFHLSEKELEEILQSAGYDCRNDSEILVSSEEHSSRQGTIEASIPQKVLESLFSIPKSCEHEPNSMNWKNVVKKMDSLGKQSEFRPVGTVDLQQNTAEGDDYQVFRKESKQHWVSMRSYYQKAAMAYSRGEKGYAAHLSEQGKFHKNMAREADEKASQEIFEARNKGIKNVVTIDLHGQHVKQAIKLLKVHLLFTMYLPSVLFLRVITGCGTHGVEKGKLKKSVISLVKKEGIEWSEENQGTVLIKLDGRKNFKFMESESDSE